MGSLSFWHGSIRRTWFRLLHFRDLLTRWMMVRKMSRNKSRTFCTTNVEHASFPWYRRRNAVQPNFPSTNYQPRIYVGISNKKAHWLVLILQFYTMTFLDKWGFREGKNGKQERRTLVDVLLFRGLYRERGKQGRQELQLSEETIQNNLEMFITTFSLLKQRKNKHESVMAW